MTTLIIETMIFQIIHRTFIYGGCNQILPKATSATQNIHDCKFMGGLKKTLDEGDSIPPRSVGSGLGS